MSLRTRLVLAVSAVALVALLAADLATYSALHSFLYGRVDQALLSEASEFQPPGGQQLPGTGSGGDNDADDAGQGFPSPPEHLAASGYYFEVRAADGDIVVPAQPVYVDGTAYEPSLPASFSGFSESTASDQPTVYFDAAATKAGGPEFRVMAAQQSNGNVVILATSLSDTQSTLHGLILIELSVTGLALIAAVLLGLWVVRVGLHPLRDVEDTADAIAAGDMDQRVPGENETTEVGRLARALNTMLARIQQAFEERDRTEAQLRQSEDRLRRFVADASHELRTPLAAVSAYAELFERGAKGRPDDLDRVITGIRGETGRMSHLVDDLFLLARLDEGRPLKCESVDLVAVASDAVQAAGAVGPGWPVTLEAEGPVVLQGDGDRLRQVLDNLLGNVRNHTPEGTATVVRVAEADGGAVVTVADRGPGLGQVDAEKIFERFYRADPSRTRAGAKGGAGLGLSIVQAIVAAHGGRVEATDGPGGGAVITIHLPPRGRTGPILPD